MREVSVSTIISAPREEIFDFVADLAGRPSFADHYMEDYRLARVQPVGLGAAARFKLDAPLSNPYAELSITKADRPRQIIEEIRYGRRGRNRAVAVYDFTRESASVTRVELTTFSEPATKIDRVKEIGAAGWLRRKTKKSLERLRRIFEEPGRAEVKRASIAGYEPEKAARFGARAGMDPARQPRP
ncbi:MAG TPA: SRPBCC family protein [Thermoleophilaceae bacterium]|jgi:hypothetical protein